MEVGHMLIHISFSIHHVVRDWLGLVERNGDPSQL